MNVGIACANACVDRFIAAETQRRKCIHVCTRCCPINAPRVGSVVLCFCHHSCYEKSAYNTVGLVSTPCRASCGTIVTLQQTPQIKS